MITFLGVLNASTVRILTYNLLNYEDENSREEDYVMTVSYTHLTLPTNREV